MTWQPIDFQGIINYKNALNEYVEQYLEEEQAHLSRYIANILLLPPDSSAPSLPAANIPMKLSAGIESFTRKINQAKKSTEANELHWQDTANGINDVAKKYAESLIEISQQLFSQLEQVSIQHWTPELLKVVEEIKDRLLHYIEDLKWALKRLESLLSEDQGNATSQSFVQRLTNKMHSYKQSYVDQAMLKDLSKCQKNLESNYQDFLQRFQKFIDLNQQIEQKMSKFSSYQVLNSLEKEDQDNFKEVYRLLKLWKRNSQEKILPEKEFISTLRYSIYPKKVSSLFKNYYNALANKLFSQSRILKENSAEYSYSTHPTIATIKLLELKGCVSGQRFELNNLESTINSYRNFLLETNTNPQVQIPDTLSEWNHENEPNKFKSLAEQNLNLKELDKLYLSFHDALPELGKDLPKNFELYERIESTLHTIAQPLAAYKTIETRSLQLVEQLNQVNELNSRDPDVTERMNTFLATALRNDWKYHTLHGIPLFHQIYNTHIHLLPPLYDRNHFNRLRHFSKALQQIQKWVKDRHTLQHLHQIELDINDMKGYLQDFLAQQQRVANDSTLFSKENGSQVISQFTQQLLEYRYLFGQFFYQVRENEVAEKQLRTELLFVDHYFDTIETKLSYMKRELIYLQDTSTKEPQLPESQNLPPESSEDHP